MPNLAIMRGEVLKPFNISERVVEPAATGKTYYLPRHSHFLSVEETRLVNAFFLVRFGRLSPAPPPNFFFEWF